MKTRQWIVAGVLLVLVVIAIIGLVLTGGPTPTQPSRKSATGGQQAASLVDQRPLQTARRLAALASTADEQRISRETLRLGDHEVDLAFADALRDAQEHPPQLSPEAREISKRVNHGQANVKADQDRIKSLQKAQTADDKDKESFQQQLEIAQAQLAMDQDELDDAKEDLARAGGDAQGKIQRLLDEHEASQHSGNNANSSSGREIDYTAPHLAPLMGAWITLGEQQRSLSQARQDALQAASLLVAKHNGLEQHVAQEQAARTSAGPQAPSAGGSTNAAETLASLHHFSDDQKSMSDLDKRIQDEQELAENYAAWSALVLGYRRIALHGMLQSALWILLIVLLVYILDRVADRYLAEAGAEKTRLRTMRAVVRFAVQAIGVLAILFVIFGAPSQTPTILGLAGAGLTVALKDFIVAFFGWFVLMGRNGIRVGDWVEINGVGGEVVEIGLLRTVLLETGNWTDSGHPTGRRVAFVNSYAVEGHYFNFSTSGQWLWDEIQLLIPAGQNPYPIIDNIQKLVTTETAANAQMAEQEWQRATSQYRVKSFSAVPSLDVRPTSSGVQVLVRYITRAHERYEMRARLYHGLVDLLHQTRDAQAAKLS